MNTEELLSEVLRQGEDCQRFYRIKNASGKVWILPERDLHTALQLYQPSGRKGRLLKRWLPVLHKVPMLRKCLHIEVQNLELEPELREMLCRLWGVERVEYAVFCGTPCVHQKLTLQLSSEGKILGYCKLSDNDEVTDLFDRESRLLRDLRGEGIESVPRVLYEGEWRSGIHALVQTTTKTTNSRVVHEWSANHEEFLRILYEKTKRSMNFEETDYCHTLEDMKSHLGWLHSDEARSVVSGAIDKVLSTHRGQRVEYGAYHADFTPWNTFVEQGQLFVFDWEYAQRSYPAMMDACHFLTQTAMFVKHWTADDIKSYVASAQGGWADKDLYELYLLDIISRFALREKGNIEGEVAYSMTVWTDMLKSLR